MNVTTEPTAFPLPGIALRLSRAELAVVDCGLQLMVARCRALRMDALDPEVHAAVQQLFETVGHLAHDAATKSHRLHLNALDLAIFAFAARLATARGVATYRRTRGFEGRSLRLIAKKLEKLRKRAKRLCLKDAPEGYASWAQRWHDFMRTLRADLRTTRVASEVADYHRTLVKAVCVNAKRLLVERGEDLPDDKELSELVRMALRHVRRGRAAVGVWELRRPTENGRAFLADFLIPRVRERVEQHQRKLVPHLIAILASADTGTPTGHQPWTKLSQAFPELASELATNPLDTFAPLPANTTSPDVTATSGDPARETVASECLHPAADIRSNEGVLPERAAGIPDIHQDQFP